MDHLGISNDDFHHRLKENHVPFSFTNTTSQPFRQQMDDSNHKMMNMITRQIAIICNLFIENTNSTYQVLASKWMY